MSKNDIPEVIRQILNLIGSLKDIDTIGGNELSEKAILLSVNKVYIGQELVKMEYNLSHNKLIRKNEWGKVYAAESGTVNAKQIVADDAVRELLGEEIELERKIGLLKNLRQDCSDVISTVQTRLAQLRSELKES